MSTFDVATARLSLLRTSVDGQMTGAGLITQLGASVTVDRSSFRGFTTVVLGSSGARSSFTATNTTFAGFGSVTGAILIQNSAVTLRFVTFLDDPGGAIGTQVNSPAFTMTGSVIAGASASGRKQCDLAAPGQLVDGGSNLASETTCPFTAATSRAGVDPGLGELDASGPVAFAAPQPGSPVINGAASCPSSMEDLGGVARPQGDLCDPGAYELRAPVIGGVPTVTGGRRRQQPHLRPGGAGRRRRHARDDPRVVARRGRRGHPARRTGPPPRTSATTSSARRPAATTRARRGPTASGCRPPRRPSPPRARRLAAGGAAPWPRRAPALLGLTASRTDGSACGPQHTVHPPRTRSCPRPMP